MKKYIFILALLVIVILSCYFYKNIETANFDMTIPPMVQAQLEKKEEAEISSEKNTKVPPDTSIEKITSMVMNYNNPGVILEGYGEKTEVLDDKIEKCRSISSCDNLKLDMFEDCGYCLQDDIEGKNAFHYGDKD